MTRILKHEPKELLAEGKRLLQSGEKSKFAYRVTMVNLLLEDSEMTTARLIELSGVPTRTLNDREKSGRIRLLGFVRRESAGKSTQTDSRTVG